MELEEYLVESRSGEYARKVWLWRGTSSGPQQLCVFLDAELYLFRMDTLATLKSLQETEAIPPMTCLLVSHIDSAARHHDYPCNSRYARFIAEDVLNWVRERYEGISELDNLICGLSLSGLASAYIALTYPERFPRALCQSGSFWWNEEWLAGNVPLLSPASQLWLSVGDRETDARVSHPPTDMRQEVSQIVAVENAVRALQAQDATVNYHLYAGGHDTVPWSEELPTALRWLLNTYPSSP